MSTSRFNPKTAAFIATAAIVTLALSSCGTSGDSGEESSDGNVTIEVWDYLGSGVSDSAMKAVVAKFEEQNPTIKVKRTSFAYADLAKTIVQSGVGGSVPDAAIVDVVDTQSFAGLGLLADVTESAGKKSKEFFEGPWGSTQFGGKTYGLPLNSNNLALYYNKALFTEANVTPPTTWEELRTVAAATTNSDHNGISISGIKSEQGTFQFLPFLWQTGGDLDSYAKDGATALGFLKSLIDDGSMSSSVANYSQEDARTQFSTGKSAMMINGPWELQNLEESGIDFGVAALPKGKESATGLGGENAVTFAEAKNKEAAQKFVEFLTSTEGATIYCDESGQLSSRPDLAGKLKLAEDPAMKVFEDQLADAHARAYGGKYTEISAAVQESMQRVLTGDATPEDAAKAAGTTIDSLLD